MLPVTSPAALAAALTFARRRFAEQQQLLATLERHAITERAVGILMEQRTIDAEAARRLLDLHADRACRPIEEVAAAVEISHPLLIPPQRPVAAD